MSATENASAAQTADGSGNKSPTMLEITNLRLSHTSRPLGIDASTPSISWAYTVPTGSSSWWQQTYILSLSSWDPSDGFRTLHEHRIVGPNTHRSGNVLWPMAFPKIQTGWAYKLEVVAVMTQHTQREDLELVSGDVNGGSWEFGNIEGSLVFRQDLAPLDLARDVANRLGLEPGVTALIQANSLEFEASIIGGYEAWQARAPGVVPISCPWDLEGWEKPKAVSVFRNWYHLETLPEKARLFATAFGVYKIYINGKVVGDSIMEPGWTEYKLRLLYQTYDVTEYLQKGDNTITVFVADGWYRGRLASGWEARRGYFGKETGFMALMETYGTDGRSFCTGSTDKTGWKCTKTSPILSSGIYDGEYYDARIALKLEDLADDEWETVNVMSDAFAGNSRVLQASIANPVRWTEILTVKNVLTSPDGKRILDFGQNTAGRIHLKGSAPAGTKITFVHVEVLLPDGSPCTNILREAKATDTYIFSGDGVEEWEPEFTFHGFRYVQVDPWIEGLEVFTFVYGSDLMLGLIKFESSHRELNRLVENIRWSARANFLAVCTDCPQRDERLGWTGDINAFGPTAVYIFDCQTFLTSWLHGLVDGQKLGGRSCPPLVSPCCLQPPGSHRPNALWQDVLITLPWYLYETYGDTSLLKSLYRAMTAYYNYGIPKDSGTGLWAGGFQFGDWLDPTAPPGRPDLPATDPMFVANSWLCNITRTLIKISRALENQADVLHWTAKAHDLIGQWRRKYIDWESSSQDLASGTTTFKVLTQDTQTAYSLALNFHLLPRKLINPAVNRLHELLVKSNYHLATGFAGTPELLHAICTPDPSTTTVDHECSADICKVCEESRVSNRPQSSNHTYSELSSVALAYKVLLGPRDPPGWLYPITMGATSIWERWDAVKPDGSVNTPGMTSLNHYAYGSCGRWIFEHIGGIKFRPFDPFNEASGIKFVFDPVPNLEFGVTKCEMTYQTFAGNVECIWKYEEDNKIMNIEVAVPGNCEGEIRILGKTLKTVGAGRWCVSVPIGEKEAQALEQGFPGLAKASLESQIPEESPESSLVKSIEQISESEHTEDEWVVV